jgi:vacuolar-type H+-ATPase subunit H
VAGILQRAHDAASQITAQSRSDAEERLERARQEAAQITATAERRLQELDTETDRIWAERQRIVDDAQALAQQLLSLAHAAAARFPAADEPSTTQEKPSRPFGVVVPEAEPAEEAAPDEVGESLGPEEAVIGPGQTAVGPEEAVVGPEEAVVGPEEAVTEEPAGGGHTGEEFTEDSFDEGSADTAETDDPDVTRVMPPITSSREDEPH